MGNDNKSDDEYSTIGDKGDIGFIDLQECTSVCSYNPCEESESFVISVPFPLVKGKPQSGLVGKTTAASVTIQNISEESLDLWSVKIYDSKPEDCFTISLREPPNESSDEQYIREFRESFALEDRILRPGQTLTIWLSCKPTVLGLHSSAVHFSIGDDTIERLCFVMAENTLSQSLASQKPFYRAKKNRPLSGAYRSESFVVGSRPSKGSRDGGYKNKLPEYLIPKQIRYLLDQKQIPEVLSAGLNPENYAFFFTTLLNMEEIKMEEDMRDYDIYMVMMKKRGAQLLGIEVLGLAERRPSLVIGDFILAKYSSENGEYTRPFQGYIHRVEAEEVHVKFHPDFHRNHRPGNLYNVQFTYNRVGMRRLYQAVEAAEYLGRELLFPSESRDRHIQTAPFVPISSTLNTEQMRSIEMILGCDGGSPYVIHGPPGTGKSMTLIEAIFQLYSTRKDARILVCAPSNSATDYLLEKILTQNEVQFQENEVFRLNAPTRPIDDMDPRFIRFCFIDDFAFKTPRSSVLRNYRIIVSTYTSASLLHAEGIRRGNFSHIFLDEAGQASEPETMVPISQLCRKTTVVALAGDPMQLGPITYSKEAGLYGSGRSYLERLFECPLYRDGNENYITRLVRNYRSHPSILHLPSKLFYNDQLISCKEEPNSPPPWLDMLPNPDFPVLFMGVQGFDEREGSNPSWFNRIEASKVVEIIDTLVNEKGVSEDEIGVITPYRQQVVKIRKALEGFDRFKIKVGSVEQFQGQERKIIIVSTVRSTIRHNEFDRIHYLGFLSNPKRFNVSITRAQSLLILVGNPHIITKDEYWNQILWYCSDNQSYIGCFLPKREEEDEFTVEETAQNEGWVNDPYPSDPATDSGWADDPYPSDPATDSGWADDPYPSDPATDSGWKDSYPSDPANNSGWLDDSYPSDPATDSVWPGDSVPSDPATDSGLLDDSRVSKSSIDVGLVEGDSSSEPVFDERKWSEGWK